MTFDEAFRFYLLQPEGPFPPAVWEKIKHLMAPRNIPEKNSIGKIDRLYCRRIRNRIQTSTGSAERQ